MINKGLFAFTTSPSFTSSVRSTYLSVQPLPPLPSTMPRARVRWTMSSVEASLADFGLEPYRTTPALQLPGGYKQRLSMAAALIQSLGEERMAAHAPLGRLGDDDDLKGLTLLYASDAGKHITGQWLAVDGGVSVITGG